MAPRSDIWRYFTKSNKTGVKEHSKLNNTNIKKCLTLLQETVPLSTSGGLKNKVGLITSCGCVSNLFCKYGF